MIIPSIDIMDGKAVQLRQGREKVIEIEDVIGLVKEFRKYGEIAVIDLDAALGKGENTELIKKICRIADCRVGGGIRDLARAEEILRAGAKKIIIGTEANVDFLKKLPKERIIVAVDVKQGNVVDKGWTRDTGKKAKDVVAELKGYCSGFLFTNVDREGMMDGCDIDLVNGYSGDITLAGGITSIDEIEQLEKDRVNSQLGMAIYSGKIDLADAFIALVNEGLLATIVQDEAGRVLMLGFSNKRSLLETFRSGKATFFSRSRQKLWTKGETSGNYQEIIKMRYDCDRDALLFTVRQTGNACHLDKYSCFGDKNFELSDLYEVISQKIENPDVGSYTSKISQDENLILEKIEEESKEVVEYTDRDNLVWEIADLTYFVLVLMAKKGISIQDVKNELWRRRK